MQTYPLPLNNTRLGFYYFPDSLHYREIDLKTWLPELKALGASWLTLPAPVDRAIPEMFIQGLLEAEIEPVLHFRIPVDSPLNIAEMRLLFSAYARWGVHYVVLFDRPNTRDAWSAPAWTQSNLVERFLDVFLPLAETARECGLLPVFPALEPGGDYWDTAFLRASLQGIQRRGHTQLLDSLVLGAYAWAGNRSLNWGAGGPERWPSARPYFTPSATQDQRGFRIFDWYLTLAQAALGRSPAIILLGAGCLLGDRSDPQRLPVNETKHMQTNLEIVSLLQRAEDSQDDEQDPVPPEVLACNFWLLSAPPESEHVRQAWIKPDGERLPVADALAQQQNISIPSRPVCPDPLVAPVQQSPTKNQPQKIYPTKNGENSTNGKHSIAHYLLLPVYEWGIADWHLDVIRPYVKKHRPTIGFSVDEARQAQRVTIVGGKQSFPESVMESLHASGCSVEHINGDGTLIASLLAKL